MNETPLAAWHRAAGARMVSFAGWRLPLQFTSVAHAVPVRRRVGFRVVEPGVARAGAGMVRDDERIGQVTSGIYSHNLGAAIGQGYVRGDAKASAGDAIGVEVRGRLMQAVLARLPFLPARTKPTWARAVPAGSDRKG